VGGRDIWTQQGARGDESERPLATWKQTRERDRKRGDRERERGREGLVRRRGGKRGRGWRAPWNAVGRRKIDGNKPRS